MKLDEYKLLEFKHFILKFVQSDPANSKFLPQSCFSFLNYPFDERIIL